MNALSSPSIVLPSRPRAGRGAGVLLRTALRALRLQWRAHQSRRRKAPALDAIGEMDAHMLRDIGAPDELISRATARRSAHYGREIPFQLWVVLVAIAVIGTATPTSAADAARAQPARGVYAAGQMPGVFTGEFIDGAPVYRFPATVVMGSRKTKPAARSLSDLLSRMRCRARKSVRKARGAADIEYIGKPSNAADGLSGSNPKGRERFGSGSALLGLTIGLAMVASSRLEPGPNRPPSHT